MAPSSPQNIDLGSSAHVRQVEKGISRERVKQLKGSVKNGESGKDGIFHLKIEGSRGSVQGSQ